MAQFTENLNQDGAGIKTTAIVESGAWVTPVKVTTAIPAGDNNIGNVDIISLPALPAGSNNIGDVDVLTLPALPTGTNTIGAVNIKNGANTLAVDAAGIASVKLGTAIPAGTNNIGDVDVLTLPALPAGTNTIGNVRVTDGTNTLFTTANPGSVTLASTDIQQPIELRSRHALTVQTHNAKSVPATSWDESAWIDCDGFNRIAVTFANDAGTQAQVNIHWSNDGVNMHGAEFSLIPQGTQQQAAGVTEIKARYARIQIYNGDAGAHVVSAWAYLKA